MTGDELRSYRRARGWRQRDLAEYLEVDQPAISEMERGMRPIPDELAARLPDSPASDPATEHHGPEPSGEDVPPRPLAPPEGDATPPRKRPEKAVVLPLERDLSQLEARVLKLIQGEDVAIAVADPGSDVVHYEAAHIPGVADVVSYANEFDGAIIRANAVAMSKAWVGLAREKPRVRQVLEALTAGGAWRGVLTATAPVILAILLNHGLLPSIPGLAIPEPGGYDGAHDDGAGGAASYYRETAAGAVG